MEKDQDLLSRLLKVGEVAFYTEVDLDMPSVCILDSHKPVEVLDEVYRIFAPPPPPPPLGGFKVLSSLEEKKKRHHHQSKKKSHATLDAQVTYTGKDVSSEGGPNPKRVKVTPAGSIPSFSLLAAPALVVSKDSYLTCSR